MKSHIKNSAAPFNELWSVNLQKLEEIHRELEKDIHRLEREYVNVGAVFTRIEDSINILASAYSRFNILQGGEYILRLRTILHDYKSGTGHGSIDFTLLDFLMGKISELRSASFQDFPSAEHGIPVTPEKSKTRRMLKSADYPWRWITFSRGNSWFIAPFVSLSVVPFSSCSILSRGHDFLTLMMDDKKLTASDPFSPYITEEPRFIIIIDSGPRSYAAQKVGRKIYASGDMITPMIQQYVQVRSSTISRGRVRLFGLNHILLG